MKTFLSITTLFFSFMILSAQSKMYKNFEGELILGGVFSGQKFGASTGLEARYNFSDKFSAGLKVEPFALIDKDAINTSGEEVTIEETYAIKNFAITAEYYLLNHKNRLFAGLEIGSYNASLETEDNDNRTELGRKIGVAPRIGAELGWFRQTLKYHLIPKFGEENLSALEISLGIVFGGGRR